MGTPYALFILSVTMVISLRQDDGSRQAPKIPEESHGHPKTEAALLRLFNVVLLALQAGIRKESLTHL